MQHLVILLEGGCVAGEYIYDQEHTATHHARLWMSGSDDNDVILYRLTQGTTAISAERAHGYGEEGARVVYTPIA